MNPDNLIDTLKSAIAYPEYRGQLFAYTGLGFASVFVAEALDLLEPAPYAAYYVGAVNSAVSPKYWDLLGVTSLMLLCLLLPLLMARQWWGGLAPAALGLCLVTQRVVAFTFTLGAVATGILLARVLIGEFDSPALLAWSELWFGSHPMLALQLLLFFNTLLGALGQALRQPEHPLWHRLWTQPGYYLWPVYGVFAGLVLALMVGQQ